MTRVFRVLIALMVLLPIAALAVYSLQARSLSHRLAAEAQQLDARRFELAGNEDGNVLECLAFASDTGPDLSFRLPMRGDEVHHAVINDPEFVRDIAARDQVKLLADWLRTRCIARI